MGLELPAIADAERNARITVESDALHGDALVCIVKAKCSAPIRVSPRSVNFGEILNGRTGTLESVLEIRGSDGEPWGDLHRISVTSGSPRISAQLSADDAGHVQLAVSLDPEGLEGDLYGAVQLQVLDSGVTVSVPIHARRVPSVRVAPSTIILPRSPSNVALRERQILVWASDGQPLGTLASVEGPDGVEVIESTSDEATKGRKRFVVRADNTAGLTANAELKLVFSARNEPVAIRLIHSASPFFEEH